MKYLQTFTGIVLALLGGAALMSLAIGSSAPAISAVPGQICQGMVSTEADQFGLPTGDSTNNCLNACDAGCASYTFTIPVLGGQSAAGCGCSDSGMNKCCQAVLTPASPAGGPVGWGACGGDCPEAGVKCVAVTTKVLPPGQKEFEAHGECIN